MEVEVYEEGAEEWAKAMTDEDKAEKSMQKSRYCYDLPQFVLRRHAAHKNSGIIFPG
jgi:hypothetical protein